MYGLRRFLRVQSFESERKYMLKSRKGQFYIIMSAMLFGIMPFLTKTAYNNGSNAYAVVFWRFLWARYIYGCNYKKVLCKNILLSRDKMLKIVVLSIFMELHLFYSMFRIIT